MTTRPRFTLVLEPVKPDGDPTQALRLALKRLLRDHGLRCVSIRQDPPITLDADARGHERPMIVGERGQHVVGPPQVGGGLP